MKNLALNMMLLMAVATGAKAQNSKAFQKADFANWVIESNVKTPKNSIIKFYNAQQELIYEEEIKGKKLNVNRKKVKTTLNEVLAKLVAKTDELPTYNLVAASLKRN